MNRIQSKIGLTFFFLFLLSYFIVPAAADASYGVQDNSEYVWTVSESISENVSYQLTARFNLRQRNVSITKYFYSNGSFAYKDLPMNQFRKFILASHEKHGAHNYFYTGLGTLDFPRHVTVITDVTSTQILDYSTGITLYYTSETQEHVLISGPIPISWVVWIILGFTIGLSSLFIIFFYKRGKLTYHVIVYDIKPKV